MKKIISFLLTFTICLISAQIVFAANRNSDIKTDNKIEISRTRPSVLPIDLSKKITVTGEVIHFAPGTKSARFLINCTDNASDLPFKYELSGNFDFSKYVGQKVKVNGTLAGNYIREPKINVISIEPVVSNKLTVIGKIASPISIFDGPSGYVLSSEADSKSYLLQGNFDFEAYIGKRVQVIGLLNILTPNNDSSLKDMLIIKVTSINELSVEPTTIKVLATDPLIDGLNISSNCTIQKGADGTIKALLMEVSLKNDKKQTINITFPTSKQYDFVLYDKNMKEIYRWSKQNSENPISSETTTLTLKPSEKKKFSETFKLYSKDDISILSQARYFKAEIPGKAAIDFIIYKAPILCK